MKKEGPSTYVFGICENVMLNEQLRLRELFPKWPEFSGDIFYPIKGYKLYAIKYS